MSRHSRPAALTATRAITAILLSLICGCDDSTHSALPIRRLLESEDNYMGPVAQKVALLHESNEISAIDFSPDGEHLATAAALGPNVRIWTWKGRSHAERTLHIPSGLGPGTAQSGLRYSADGRLLAIVHGRSRPTEGYGVVRIWNTQTGEVVGQLSEPSGGGDLGRIAFTPDSKFLLRSYDRIETVPGDHLVAHQNGQWGAVWGIRTNPFIPEALALSLDGKFVALGGEVFAHERVFSQILIVDVNRHLVTSTIDTNWQGVPVNQIVWSPDGVSVAVGARLNSSQSGQPAIRAFNIPSGHQVFEQSTAECDVTGLAFTPDGKYFLQAGKGLSVEVWDSEHKRMLQRIPVSAAALALSPDGHHFAIAEGSAIAIWELK